MPLKKKKLVLKKKRKRGQRAGLTRDKIRDASLKVWMEKPAEDFSLNDVARALDVFPVTIRSHYKGGRGEILDEIARDILIGIAPPFTSKNDPKAYLSAVFSEAATIARKSPSLLRELAFRLADRPLLSPQFAERICAILADLAPEADAAWGLKLVINRLSGLLFTG